MPDRMALVVGINAYTKVPLKCCVNDASAVHAALQRMGFTSKLEVDCDINALLQATRSFVSSVKPGDIALFYFAGHGAEATVLQAGKHCTSNWLLASEVPSSNADLPRYALDAHNLLADLEARGARFNALVLDCCRNDPALDAGGRSLGGGLASMDPKGSLVAFACAPGARSAELPGSTHGVFTEHLLQHIEKPGLEINTLFIRVGNAVEQATRHLPQAQRPYVNCALRCENASLHTGKRKRGDAPAPTPGSSGVDLTGQSIALYNPANDRWLRVTGDGAAEAHSTGKTFQAWWGAERFEVRDVGAGHLALYSPINERWLRVLGPSDEHRVDAYCKSRSFDPGWRFERLQIRDVGDGHVGLYFKASDRWLSVTPVGEVKAFHAGFENTIVSGESSWERFKVTRLNPVHSSRWRLEDCGEGAFRIISEEKPDYKLDIRSGQLFAGLVENHRRSSWWRKQPCGDGVFRLVNVEQADRKLHIKNGALEASPNVLDIWESAMWREDHIVDGVVLLVNKWKPDYDTWLGALIADAAP